MSKWNLIFTFSCIAVAGFVSWIDFANRQPGAAFICTGLFAAVIVGNFLLSRKKK